MEPKLSGRKRALVTGGAGLIGSHTVDLLRRDGWQVRVLDNLEPITHRQGRPSWIPDTVDFRHADVRDRASLTAALQGVDIVFHLAACGGHMPEIAKFVAVNSLGTAQLLEIIRDEKLPVEKVVVASSQAVYREGAARCAAHGLVFPPSRSVEQLTRGDFSVRCPLCGAPTEPVPTPEHAPATGATVYAITKRDQEELVLAWGRQTGIPTVALRYSCTYGPRQSPSNPYAGVIAIFATRLLNGLPPVLYEDGWQSRDLCYVEDVARANLIAASTDRLDGRAVNVGSGRATAIRDLATLVADGVGVPIDPVCPGEFRPGEIRHLIADIEIIRATGWEPEVDLETGVARYLAWLHQQGSQRDMFEAAATGLRARGIVQRIPPSAARSGAAG